MEFITIKDKDNKQEIREKADSASGNIKSWAYEIIKNNLI